MKPKLLLRIAAILILIHAILHTMGFTSWRTDTDPARQAVIQAMNGPKLPFMGTNRNMGEYYDGFGYASSITLLLITSLLWITSGELLSNTSLAKKTIVILFIGLLAWGVDELIYFFPFAATISLLACLCCFLSLFTLNRQASSK